MSTVRALLTLTCLAAGGAAAAAPPLFHEEVVARQWLAARPELARGGDLVVERREPGLVRFRRHHRGVPIVGGVVVVRLDEGGAVRGADADPGDVPAGLSVEPTLTPEDARALASDFGPIDRASERLEVLALPEHEPRLAWAVTLPYDPRSGAWRIHVDAQDGRILSFQDLVQHAKRAKVFKSANPVVGTLEEVTLDVPDGAQRPANPSFDVKSCVDRKSCKTLDGVSFRDCDFDNLAVADSKGDFLYDRPAVDTAEDPLAEVNVFYHMTRAEAAFKAAGAPHLVSVPMRVFVNYRVAADDEGCFPDKPLTYYENAFFTSAFEGTDAFVFGQGEEADYSYDWPVVFHEFTHGVQYASYGSIQTFRFDEAGLNNEGGALSEGTADYFAAVFTAHTKLGEYALPADLIRDIAVQQKCPQNLTGEIHEDGKIFASALWAARVALPEAQRALLDQAVLRVFARTGDVSSFEFFRRTTIEEMTALAGATAAATVEQKLAANGVASCRRVVDLALGQKWPFIFAFSSSERDLYFPSTLQWKMTLPRKADRLVVRSTSRIERVAGVLRVAVKAGQDSIKWDLDTLRPDTIRYETTARDANTLVVTGPFEAGPQVVQFAVGRFPTTPGINGVFLGDVSIEAEYAAEPPKMNDGGGGCAVGGDGGASGAAAAMLLALLAWLTSRSSSRPCRGSRSSR